MDEVALNPMTDVLTRRGDLCSDTGAQTYAGKMPREDGGRDGEPGGAKGGQKLTEKGKPFPRPSEGHSPADTATSDLWPPERRA